MSLTKAAELVRKYEPNGLLDQIEYVACQIEADSTRKIKNPAPLSSHTSFGATRVRCKRLSIVRMGNGTLVKARFLPMPVAGLNRQACAHLTRSSLPLDPRLNADHPPNDVTKVGFDCTIPLVGKFDPFSYAAATVAEPLKVDTSAKQMSDDEIATEMEKMIREKPQSWNDLLKHFGSQNYRSLYRAFGQLLPKLGRMADQRPDYPYVFSDTNFVYSDQKPQA